MEQLPPDPRQAEGALEVKMRFIVAFLILSFPIGFTNAGDLPDPEAKSEITFRYDVVDGVSLEQNGVVVNMLDLEGTAIERTILENKEAEPYYRFQKQGRKFSEVVIWAGSSVTVAGVISHLGAEFEASRGQRRVERERADMFLIAGGTTILAGISLLELSIKMLDVSVSATNAGF